MGHADRRLRATAQLRDGGAGAGITVRARLATTGSTGSGGRDPGGGAERKRAQWIVANGPQAAGRG